MRVWTRQRLSLKNRRKIRYPKEPWVSKDLSDSIDHLESSYASDHVSSSLYATLLRRCTKEQAFSLGVRVHNHMSAARYLRSTYMNNLLIKLYGRCGDPDWARDVFEITPKRNVFTWNTMMRLLEQNSKPRRVFRMFWRMRTEGLPDAASYALAARACGHLRLLREGRMFHDEVMQKKLLLPHDNLLQSSLIFMYGRCGRLDVALQVFRDVELRELPVWNAVLVAACKGRELKLAVVLYHEMLQEGRQPDKVTFWIMLEVYMWNGDMHGARGIGESVAAAGLDQLNSKKLQLALIKLYAKSLMFDKTRKLLDRLPLCNRTGWSSSIRIYVENNRCEEALELYHAMRARCTNPDAETFIAVLGACSNPEYIVQGKAIYARLVATMVPRGELVPAIIKMFSDCGSLRDAKMVFDRRKTTRRSHWNAMLSAYHAHGRHEDCMTLFKAMQAEGVRLNEATYRIIFSACSSGGMQHGTTFGNWLLSSLSVKGQALTPSMQQDVLGMFAAHGDVENAEKTFVRMNRRDFSAWCCLARAYAATGRVAELCRFVSFMELEGFPPKYEELVWRYLSTGNMSPSFFRQFTETFQVGCSVRRFALHAAGV